MFKIDPSPRFWTDVKFTLPGEQTQTFRVRFKIVPVSVYSAMNRNDAEEVRQVLADAICDLADIEDVDGQPAQYSQGLVGRLLDMPHLRGAFLNAYADGITKAAQGN